MGAAFAERLTLAAPTTTRKHIGSTVSNLILSFSTPFTWQFSGMRKPQAGCIFVSV
ncbi:hypothetical protein ABT063_43305 [Streptomyces sp. NPDC002838]|uniref:hypothetical protein n=1 Tax=Streptomyces sp. NPDC002838 TaxID=3154436 RepID=UPI00332A2637